MSDIHDPILAPHRSPTKDRIEITERKTSYGDFQEQNVTLETSKRARSRQIKGNIVTARKKGDDVARLQ